MYYQKYNKLETIINTKEQEQEINPTLKELVLGCEYLVTKGYNVAIENK
jgi:hypothetical protein